MVSLLPSPPRRGGGLIPKIIEMKEEPKIVSYSRDKKGKIENYHTKEVANTIHCSTGTRGNTAQYVLEPKPIVEMNNHGETVSIAEPFVVACRGREPNVLTPKRTEYGKKVRKEWESHKLIQQRKYMQQLEPRTDGVSNTITSVQKDNMLFEPLRIKANTREGFAEVEEYGAVNISQPSSCTRRGIQTEFSESVGSTLTSARPNNVYGDTFPYRIRRLTPRECFRLMDVDDEDYDKIKNYVKGHRKNGKPMYISESQQYKLAGNSIVVACMEHIFEQLFFPSGRVTEPRQLDIFDII